MKAKMMIEILRKMEAKHPGLEVFFPLMGEPEKMSISTQIHFGLAHFSSEVKPFIIIYPETNIDHIIPFPGVNSHDIQRKDGLRYFDL